MEFEVITAGNTEVLRAAFMGLSAIFSDGNGYVDTSSSIGFGIGAHMFLATLIALMFAVISGVRDSKLEVHHVLVGMMAFSVFFVPKADVVIVDPSLATGAVYVEDVPIGIAMVASFSSRIFANITDDLETYTTPASDRQASKLLSHGFMDPLKVMMQIRSIVLDSMDPKLAMDYHHYMLKCVEPSKLSGDFKDAEYVKANNSVNYLFDTTHIKNTFATLLWDPATDVQEGVSCHYAADIIKARMATLCTPISNSGCVNVVRGRIGRNGGGAGSAGRSPEQALNDSFGALVGTGTDGGDFMLNVLNMNMHAAYQENSRKMLTGADTTFIQTMSQTTALRAMDSAIEGSIFINYMFPAMQLAQFLFYTIAPLIGFLMIAAGPMALRMLGSYMLFGVWAHSWMPIASIINNYTEYQVYFFYSEVNSGGLGINELTGLFNEVQNQIAVAGQAMALAPTILAGLLTGSAFALMKTGDLAGSGHRNREGTALSTPSLQRAEPLSVLTPRTSNQNVPQTFGGATNSAAVKAVGTLTNAQNIASIGTASISRGNELANVSSQTAQKTLSTINRATRSAIGSLTERETRTSSLDSSASQRFYDSVMAEKDYAKQKDMVQKMQTHLGGEASFGAKVPFTEIGGKFYVATDSSVVSGESFINKYAEKVASGEMTAAEARQSIADELKLDKAWVESKGIMTDEQAATLRSAQFQKSNAQKLITAGQNLLSAGQSLSGKSDMSIDDVSKLINTNGIHKKNGEGNYGSSTDANFALQNDVAKVLNEDPGAKALFDKTRQGYAGVFIEQDAANKDATEAAFGSLQLFQNLVADRDKTLSGIVGKDQETTAKLRAGTEQAILTAAGNAHRMLYGADGPNPVDNYQQMRELQSNAAAIKPPENVDHDAVDQARNDASTAGDGAPKEKVTVNPVVPNGSMGVEQKIDDAEKPVNAKVNEVRQTAATHSEQVQTITGGTLDPGVTTAVHAGLFGSAGIKDEDQKRVASFVAGTNKESKNALMDHLETSQATGQSPGNWAAFKNDVNKYEAALKASGIDDRMAGRIAVGMASIDHGADWNGVTNPEAFEKAVDFISGLPNSTKSAQGVLLEANAFGSHAAGLATQAGDAATAAKATTFAKTAARLNIGLTAVSGVADAVMYYGNQQELRGAVGEAVAIGGATRNYGGQGPLMSNAEAQSAYKGFIAANPQFDKPSSGAETFSAMSGFAKHVAQIKGISENEAFTRMYGDEPQNDVDGKTKVLVGKIPKP